MGNVECVGAVSGVCLCEVCALRKVCVVSDLFLSEIFALFIVCVWLVVCVCEVGALRSVCG